MDIDELENWVLERFNFEISRSSLASHKNHKFLADIYPFMYLKRSGKPEPREPWPISSVGCPMQDE